MSAPETASRTRNWAPPADLEGLQRKAWIIGGIGTVLSLVGFFVDSSQFYHSYLVSWLMYLGVALGCMAIFMLHQLSRGGWGIMIRRILESAAGTLPFLTVLFIPIVLGMQDIYIWARPDVVATDELIQAKVKWLNPMGFTLRGFGYLAIWSLFSWLLIRASTKQDETDDPALFRRMRLISAPGLAIYCLLGTFASVDWLMSLDPHWYSSLFGVYFIGGQGVAAFAFVIPVALYLSKREPMSGAIKQSHFHDYGKLLLAFVMLWSYFALSQLLIIWMGHLPEEIVWYIERSTGGWQYIALLLAFVHFALPFLLLLSRDIKRDARRLAVVALILLLMRWFDLFWLAAPAFNHHGLQFHWLDLTTLVGLGGLWFGVFVGRLRKRPIVPVNEPFLEEALAK